MRGVVIVAAAAAVAAQEPTARPVIQGTVFDSVAGRPLADASVQLARRNAAGAVRRVDTDATGRYRFFNVPPGDYLVGFDHEALTALGLDTPVRALSVSDVDTLLRVDLAIPSSSVVRALRCGPGSPADRGLLLGTIRDVVTQRMVPGTTLQMEWGALALDSGNARMVTERASATVESDGTYVLCGLPLDAPLTLDVTSPGHYAVVGPVVELPTTGIGRLDLRLVRADTERGAAVIRGVVQHTSGKAVAGGRVLVPALAREVSVRDGAFVFGDLPAGTWVVEARVVGTAPRARLVTVEAGAPAEVALQVAETAQVLDAVTVVGAMDRDSRVLQDVLTRRRHYGGTFFLPGSDAMKFAFVTSDLLKEARALRWISPTRIVRVPNGCVALFVDDAYQPAGMEVLDLVAPLKDVLAVEAYPTIALAPIQYRHPFGCVDPRRPGHRDPPQAVVVVWTRRRF
ncbi:MAG TPA: carboxypeptidase-like regulatory domain-containing protein [Gemmatimonadaceae bacterium]|jgi:hypothetical protein